MTDQKRRGYFEKILCLDAETSGLFFANESSDPSFNEKTGESYQAVSWGMVVADFKTLEPIDQLYVEIQWNGESLWSDKAEAVHGLSKDHLAANGCTEEEALVQIGEFIFRHFGDTSVCTLGHNHVRFDLPFLQTLARKFGMKFKFGNRHIDTNALAAVCWEAFNSDELFDFAGLPEREQHNALEDIIYTLEAARRTRVLFNTAIQ